MRLNLRIHSIFILGVMLTALPLHARDRAPAQDNSGGYKFQPPRPPPLDGEAFDDDDDTMDMGDDAYRPPPPPPGAPNADGNDGDAAARPYQPPLYTQSTFTSAKTFHFKVVEGEFWQKGMKRQRGAEIHVTDGTGGAGSK